MPVEGNLGQLQCLPHSLVLTAVPCMKVIVSSIFCPVFRVVCDNKRFSPVFYFYFFNFKEDGTFSLVP